MSKFSYSSSQRGLHKPPSGMDLAIDGQSMHSGSSRPQSSMIYGSQRQKSRIQSAYSGSRSKQKTGSIPITDLMRIKENIGLGDGVEDYDQSIKEKTTLYEKSLARRAKWPNSRQKRDDAKFERFKKDEEERRRIDEEERLIMLENKKKILDKANKQLYERDDKIKQFQSKIAVVDALAERKQQIALKEQINEIHKKREQIYIDAQNELIRKEDEKEELKKEELKKKRAQTAKILREQHQLQKNNFIEQLQSKKIEGEIIKVRAMELLEKEKEEERQRKLKAKQLQEDIRKGNDNLKVLRKQLKDKELQEEAEIEKHAQRKQDLEDMRKRREHFIFNQKQAERQKLLEAQAKRLEEIKNRENARINKDIKEAEIKAQQDEIIKQQKRKQLVKNIDNSIKQNLEKKRIQSAREREEDIAYKNFWVQKNKEIQEREKRDKQEAYERSKNLQEFHKNQAAEKQRLREKEVYQELEEEQRIKALQENEHKNFNSWAARMIEAQAADGKDVGPLLTQLANLNAQK